MGDPVRDLSRQIQALRKQRGFSQAELARRARVGRRVMIELEAGKPTVRLDVLRRVLHVFGATVAIDLPGQDPAKLTPARRTPDAVELSPVECKLSPVGEAGRGKQLKSLPVRSRPHDKLSPVNHDSKLSPVSSSKMGSKLSPVGSKLSPVGGGTDGSPKLSPDGGGTDGSPKLSPDGGGKLSPDAGGRQAPRPTSPPPHGPARPTPRYARPVDEDWID